MKVMVILIVIRLLITEITIMRTTEVVVMIKIMKGMQPPDSQVEGVAEIKKVALGSFFFFLLRAQFLGGMATFSRTQNPIIEIYI